MLELTPLKGAIKSLDDSLRIVGNADFMMNLDTATKNLLRSGVIHNFGIAYELSWKFMEKYLEINLGRYYVDGIHRKELFRIAAEYHLIDNVEAWFDYNKARNLTSQTYREEYANDVFKAAGLFLTDAKKLAEAIEVRNG